MDQDPVTPLAVGVGGSLKATGRVSIARGQAGFNFHLVWDREEALGRLTLHAGTAELWSHSLDRADLVSLVLGLAGAWEALAVEESYPHSVTLDHPSQLGP
jgi:hypothetical protein